MLVFVSIVRYRGNDLCNIRLVHPRAKSVDLGLYLKGRAQAHTKVNSCFLMAISYFVLDLRSGFTLRLTPPSRHSRSGKTVPKEMVNVKGNYSSTRFVINVINLSVTYI